jgi:hypothetical protein
MSNVADVLTETRSHLMDDVGTVWSDARLLPKFRAAYRDLILELELNDIPVTHKVSTTILLPAGTKSYTITDIAEPEFLWERVPGTSEDDWVDMNECDALPMREPQPELLDWAWIGGVITFVGATTDREIKVEYNAISYLPTNVNDPIIIPFSESFLALKTAMYASVGPRGSRDVSLFGGLAETALEKLIAFNVTGKQGVPVRRQGYRETARRWRAL